MNGPHTYAELSEVARQIINSKPKYTPKPIRAKYEYVNFSTNLPKKDSKKPKFDIHTYLSPYAITDEVSKEFGKAVDLFA